MISVEFNTNSTYKHDPLSVVAIGIHMEATFPSLFLTCTAILKKIILKWYFKKKSLNMVFTKIFSNFWHFLSL